MKTKFRRKVRAVPNPEYKEELPVSPNEESINDVAMIMIEGQKEQVNGCENFITNELKEVCEEINCSETSIESIKSICYQFNVSYSPHPTKKDYYHFKGSEKQILKAENALLRKKLNKIEIDYPKIWTPTEDDIVLIDEPRNSENWDFVEKKMKESLPSFTLHKVERVQNKILWKLYFENKLKIKEKHGDCKTDYLFHGTSSTDPKDIYNSHEVSFDTRFSNQGMWGRGMQITIFKINYYFFYPKKFRNLFRS
jgi:hypothetical protein